MFSSASLIYHRLYKGHLVCVLPTGHSLSPKEAVTLDDLAGETLILLDHDHCPPEMNDIQLMIRRNGKDLRYYFSGSSLYTIPMIVAGLGIAVMPDSVCPPEKSIITVPVQIKYSVEYGMIGALDLFYVHPFHYGAYQSHWIICCDKYFCFHR